MRIIDELNELIAAEVISPEIAERIRNYAQERARSSSSHRLLLIFGSLGALLIGLGVIVLLAHNAGQKLLSPSYPYWQDRLDAVISSLRRVSTRGMPRL